MCVFPPVLDESMAILSTSMGNVIAYVLDMLSLALDFIGIGSMFCSIVHTTEKCRMQVVAQVGLLDQSQFVHHGVLRLVLRAYST